MPVTPTDDNLEAFVDPQELALMQANTGDLGVWARFAPHLLERVPGSLFGRLMLAEVGPTMGERVRLLDEAVELGRKRWEPMLRGKRRGLPLSHAHPAAVFAVCLAERAAAYGSLGLRRTADQSTALLKRLDPGNRLRLRPETQSPARKHRPPRRPVPQAAANSSERPARKVTREPATSRPRAKAPGRA